jgi:hypothetical protein
MVGLLLGLDPFLGRERSHFLLDISIIAADPQALFSKMLSIS